jgi:cytochrome c biogenesis protein ResB
MVADHDFLVLVCVFFCFLFLGLIDSSNRKTEKTWKLMQSDGSSDVISSAKTNTDSSRSSNLAVAVHDIVCLAEPSQKEI